MAKAPGADIQLMQRIWPPRPEPERPVALSEAERLRDWCVRFEVTLRDDDAAERFVGFYRRRFIRSAAVRTGSTAWVTFTTGGADERDACVQAAMTVKIVAELKAVKAVPIVARIHYTDDMGEIPGPDQDRRRTEREELLMFAHSIGAIPEPPSPAPRRLHEPRGHRWIGPGGGV